MVPTKETHPDIPKAADLPDQESPSVPVQRTEGTSPDGEGPGERRLLHTLAHGALCPITTLRDSL